jgi:hypothetical protein
MTRGCVSCFGDQKGAKELGPKKMMEKTVIPRGDSSLAIQVGLGASRVSRPR